MAQATLTRNVLREGLILPRTPDPAVMVIFGASGDLTHKKLLPALYNLAHEGALPEPGHADARQPAGQIGPDTFQWHEAAMPSSVDTIKAMLQQARLWWIARSRLRNSRWRRSWTRPSGRS